MDGERECVVTPTQRQFLALVYADPEGTLTREQATWLLWGRGESRQTRHRIRQLIYAINNRSPVPALERSGEAVVPCLPSDATEVPPGDDPPLSLLTSAPTAPFEHWLDTARARLERLRRYRLARDVDRAQVINDWDQVAEISKRLARLDDAANGWVELVTSASIRAGQLASCLAFLADLREGGLLDPEVYEGLALRLDAVPAPLERSTDPIVDPQYVGRVRETAWVQERARVGTGLRFAVVAGAQGIGKTRLLHEVGRLTASHGLRVCVIRLTELSAVTPLSGMGRLLSEVLPAGGLTRVPEPWGGILRQHEGLAESVEILEPTANHRRLTQAFRMAFREATRGQATTLLVDDLQWLDPTTLDLLQGLSVNWDGGPCSIILAVRVEAGGTVPPRIAAFIREVRSDLLTLHPMDEGECTRLLRNAGISGLTSTDFAELFQIAGGNPLLLLGLARAWTSGSWDKGAVPSTLHAVVDRQLASLSGPEIHALSLVAAASSLSSEQISDLAGLPPWDTVEALRALEAADVIVAAGPRYGFRHSLLRDAVRQALGPTRTREAHLRLGRWLAASGSGNAAEIVHHFELADSLDEAYTWAKSAAEAARDSGALVEALDFYEVALESSERGLDPDLIAEAGRLSLLLCQRDKGIRLLQRAEQFVEGGNLTWRMEILDALSEDGRLDHSDAAEQVQSLAQAAAESGDWVGSVTGTETAIRILERAGDWKRIEALLETVARSTGEGGPRAEIRRGMVLGLGMVYGAPARASAAAREAFRLALSAFPESNLTARAAHRLFVVLLSEGTVNSDLGRECVAVLEDRARLTGDLRLHYSTLANRAVWHLDTGDIEVAEAILREAEGVVVGSEASNERQNLATNRGDLLLRKGEPAAALEFFQEAEGLIAGGTRGFLRDLVRSGQGICHLRMGRFRAAELALEDLSAHSHYYFDPSLLVTLRVEVLWHRGKRGHALDHLSETRKRIERSFVPQYLNLTLWEASLRRRSKQPDGRLLAEEVLGLAEQLRLTRVAARARALASLDWR